jgi:hypothetical protein
MELKDKLDCLKYISQIHRSQFDERRKIEFKILFSTLSFYILSVAAIYGGKVQLPSNWMFIFAIWVVLSGVAVITVIYLLSIHKACNMNKTFAENAEHAIDDLIQGNEPTTLPLFSTKNSQYWVGKGDFCKKEAGRAAWIWETITVIFLLSLPVG